MIVDFAVINDALSLILAEHRLVSARNIDDAQSLVPKTHALVQKQATVVWPTMAQHVAHAFQDWPLQLAPALARKRYSTNAAHESSLQLPFEDGVTIVAGAPCTILQSNTGRRPGEDRHNFLSVLALDTKDTHRSARARGVRARDPSLLARELAGTREDSRVDLYRLCASDRVRAQAVEVFATNGDAGCPV